MAATVMLDAGHGGWHNGASFEGRLEKDDALNLTLAVGRILEDNGINVLYTRTEDIYKSPGERAREANAAGVDYFVSIHRNSSPIPGQYSGIESLVYSLGGEAERLAENINRNLEEVGFINHGINERPGLVVLNSTQMPAVLVEAGFINTPADNYLFDTKFDEIAQAIAGGILETVA
ncbi:MAG: N-acetylmuramoyl-L-alanine amidase [Lachnospiraceae bacterium]|mgnify:CR=1 FL=1|nr:N-acetylmuramoyl-L-alanine amidase [Lachnospiraceae bacterium]